jgi:hypothetical protein
MNSWLGRAFVVLAGCFVVFTIYQGARDIGMGKVSSPEAACLLMLIFSFGALMGNYHRNKTLEGVLLTLVYALVAVGEWFHTHTSLFPTLWGLMAVLYAFANWTKWRAQPVQSAPTGPSSSATHETH